MDMRVSTVGVLLACAARAALLGVQPSESTVLEVRAYTLKPRARDAFHARFIRESLPPLRRARVDVVAFGLSLHDADSSQGPAALERSGAKYVWLKSRRSQHES